MKTDGKENEDHLRRDGRMHIEGKTLGGINIQNCIEEVVVFLGTEIRFC